MLPVRFLWKYNFVLLPGFYLNNEQLDLERNSYYQDLQGLLKLTSAIAGYTREFLIHNFSISSCDLALMDNREKKDEGQTDRQQEFPLFSWVLEESKRFWGK